MSATTTEEKPMGFKFDERGKAEYAEQILQRWGAGELDDEEALTVLAMLEMADEDGNVLLEDEVGL